MKNINIKSIPIHYDAHLNTDLPLNNRKMESEKKKFIKNNELLCVLYMRAEKSEHQKGRNIDRSIQHETLLL